MKNLYRNTSCAGLLVLAAIVFALIWVLSLWTDRNLEFWLSYWKGQPVEVPGWLSFLATFILNGIILLANTIGEIARAAMF